MTKPLTMIVCIIALCTAAALAAGQGDGFSPSVDVKGNISLPRDFQSTWVRLGTWLVTSQLPTGSGLDGTAPGPGFHDVYTQPESLRSYKKTGIWPDGSVLVMEVRDVAWDDLPTGHVMKEGEVLRWLMMVKDGKGRFPGNPVWGNGWGWAVFTPADPGKNVAGDYQKSCMSCHEPAKSTDFIFIEGYPVAR